VNAPDHRSSVVSAVVVDYAAGPVLAECVGSLRAEGVAVVVVENGDPGHAQAVLPEHWRVPVIDPGRNLGYGAGANRGVAAGVTSDYVLVCNPDLHVHPGAVRAMADALDAEPAWAIVGPTVLTPEGDPYPSVRQFPSLLDAAGHAVLGRVLPDNPFTRRYRSSGAAGGAPAQADWVSGACILARRDALEELGGFDEAYFMFAEDMDLCWRAHRAGWGVGWQPAARVTHVQGVSTRRHPYRMLLAHHRSALRFVVRSTEGWRRVTLPLAAAVLGARLAAATAIVAARSRAIGAARSRAILAVPSVRAADGSVVASRSQSQAKRPT
jgi:N-acetylglucosaminyl-diphospho-decaprenol L-rhamnosyltransferase